MLLRLIQAGGIFSFIAHLIIAIIVFGPGVVVGFLMSVIVEVFSSNSDIAIEVALVVGFSLTSGVMSWVLHRHLVTNRPKLTIKARFLKYSIGSRRYNGVATFRLQNNKKLVLTFGDDIIRSLKRDDIVTLTYQGTDGISAKKIPPSSPPPKPQLSIPQTLQGTRKPPPPARKTTTPSSRNTQSKPTRK